MLRIRNMESSRCIAIVKDELNKLGLQYKAVDLGEVELMEKITESTLMLFNTKLKNSGLEIIIDKKKLIVQKIKEAIHLLVYFSDDLYKPVYSEYICKFVERDYSFLSNLFSGDQGISIEKYIIAQKIEHTKELLKYDTMSLSDIAFKLQYSSTAHLSNQFKKITGITPSFFRESHHKTRESISY